MRSGREDSAPAGPEGSGQWLVVSGWFYYSPLENVLLDLQNPI